MELGCVPEGVSWQIDVTPVDFAARAIVHVSVDQPSKGLGNVRLYSAPLGTSVMLSSIYVAL